MSNCGLLRIEGYLVYWPAGYYDTKASGRFSFIKEKIVFISRSKSSPNASCL